MRVRPGPRRGTDCGRQHEPSRRDRRKRRNPRQPRPQCLDRNGMLAQGVECFFALQHLVHVDAGRRHRKHVVVHSVRTVETDGELIPTRDRGCAVAECVPDLSRGSDCPLRRLAVREDHRRGPEDELHDLVRNLCRTATDTEETLHEAFLTAWHDLRAFPSGVRFSTWLYSIATRTALAYRMRRYHGKRTSNQLGALLPTFDGKGRLIARASRWLAVEETPAGRIDITAALRDALESIDDLARAAFVLCDVLELRPEEAAVILEASPRSVRHYAHQACLLLRGFIDRL